MGAYNHGVLGVLINAYNILVEYSCVETDYCNVTVLYFRPNHILI